jgi:DNA polymerase epsilon subunit 1
MSRRRSGDPRGARRQRGCSPLDREIRVDPYRQLKDEAFSGFLVEFETTSTWEGGDERPGLDLFYYTDEEEAVTCFLPHDPYFYVDCEDRYKSSDWSFNALKRRIKEIAPEHIRKVELVEIRDSQHQDHKFLKGSQMVKITVDSPRSVKSSRISLRDDVLELEGVVGGWREADVHFDTRTSIDRGDEVKIGRHYKVFVRDGVALKMKEDPVGRFPDLPSCAFDLETDKDPMKTPNPETNPIGTIGAQFDYDGGVVICNGELFDEVPSKFIMGVAEVEGKKVLHWEDIALDEELFREDHDDCMVIDPVIASDEHEALVTFMQLLEDRGTMVIATFNGDGFDWPYIAKRMEAHDDDIERFGFKRDHFYGTYSARGVLNIDIYRYIDQHSRLPQGSRGLKSATAKFFGFKPVDWDDAEALMRAMDPESPDYDPVSVVYYNGSDIYCTMLFLKEMVLPYFFSLAMDKPMNMFSISRRGFSSICEAGLMERARRRNVLSPNRASGGIEPGSVVEVEGREYYLIKESYKGAVVELNQPGMYRSDWDMSIEIDPNGIERLIGDVEEALRLEFRDWLREDKKVLNFDEVAREARDALEKIKSEAVFRDGEWRYEKDLVIIHADVSSLYPSIIITFQIQPHALVTEGECAACPLREEDPPCWHTLPWTKMLTVVDSREEDEKEAKVLHEIAASGGKDPRLKECGVEKGDGFMDILQKVVQKRRKGGFKREFELPLEARMCQKAHGLFVNEIEDVRTDRYKYKYRAIDLFEEARRLESRAESEGLGESERQELRKRAAEKRRLGEFNNHIQKGKKAGLNSYYGYLFAPGVRWRCIESPGTVTIRGREVLLSGIEYTSPAMELREADTDGYYALMPKEFPLKLEVEVEAGSGDRRTEKVDLLSSLLNLHCKREFTNRNNYEPVCCDEPRPSWSDGKMICDNCGEGVGWRNEPRCTLKFDTDGPYHAMFVQAMKKYCLWGFDGERKVLKGLETKRNNALPLEREIINSVFDRYTGEGSGSPAEGYEAAESYFRSVVRELKKGEGKLDALAKTTDVSKKNLKRFQRAVEARDRVVRAGAKDFAFGFDDIQFLRLCLKYKAGEMSGYKFTAVSNSLGRSKDDPLFQLPEDLIREALEAYGGKRGINQGAQFMCAFRKHDMGAEIDEYSSVTFVKSRYPVGKWYRISGGGKLSIKEIRGGVSECSVPRSLLAMDPETIRKYIERWTGNDPDLSGGTRGIVDFDYYVDYIQDLSSRLIVAPAAAQGISISMEDLFDDSLVKTVPMDEFVSKGRPEQNKPGFKRPDIPKGEKGQRNRKEKGEKGEGKTLSIRDFIN